MTILSTFNYKPRRLLSLKRVNNEFDMRRHSSMTSSPDGEWKSAQSGNVSFVNPSTGPLTIINGVIKSYVPRRVPLIFLSLPHR